MKNSNQIKWKPFSPFWEISENGKFVRINRKVMEKFVQNG